MTAPRPAFDGLTQDELRARLHATAARIDERLLSLKSEATAPFDRLRALPDLAREKPLLALGAAVALSALVSVVAVGAHRRRKAHSEAPSSDPVVTATAAYREAVAALAAAEAKRGAPPTAAIQQAFAKIPPPVFLPTTATPAAKKKSLFAIALGSLFSLGLQFGTDALKKELLGKR